MSSAALAAEPLTEKQMDAVTAGASVLGPYLLVTTATSIDSILGTITTANTETYFVVVPTVAAPNGNGS